jgi:TCP-1/cpn60 chaperonin family
VCSGKASISNDGATIMKLLDVVHPAAKTLVEIAKSQDSEVLQSNQFPKGLIYSCLLHILN